jgi:hypothetical protein
MWQNGRFPIIDLPETAPPEQVIKRIFELTGFNNGHVKNFEILEIRHVDIGGAPYSAALVQTDLGEKIVLFTAGGGMRWSRVCDP